MNTLPISNVGDPDSFYTDPDSGIFCNPDPVPDPGKKEIFSKAITKFWENFFFQP